MSHDCNRQQLAHGQSGWVYKERCFSNLFSSLACLIRLSRNWYLPIFQDEDVSDDYGDVSDDYDDADVGQVAKDTTKIRWGSVQCVDALADSDQVSLCQISAVYIARLDHLALMARWQALQYRSVTHVSIWRQHWPFDGCRVSTSISYRKTVCPLLSLPAVYRSCGKYTKSIWLWCPMTKGFPSTLNAFCLLFCSANVMNSCIPWNTHPVQRKKTSEMIIVVTLF